MTTTTDPFDQAPASTAGGAFVRLHQLAEGLDKPVTREYASGDDQKHQTIKTKGRLVLMTPVESTEVANTMPGAKNKMQTRWTVKVAILDGPPITHSVNQNTKEETELPEPVVPNSANAVVDGMFVTAVMLGDQLRQKHEAGGGMLLGRIGALKARGNQNPPYVLCEFTPEEAAVAREYLAKFHNPFAD